VSNRYAPAALPPSPALIEDYLCAAQWPTAADVQRYGRAALDAERVKAVRALRTLWQQWHAEVAEPQSGLLLPARVHAQRVRERWIAELGAPEDFDFELQDFFDRAGRVIFMSADPPAAMRVFWEGMPRRGRPDNAERDIALAIDVQERINAGATSVAAREAVAAKACLSDDDIRKIYYRWRVTASAELAVQRLEKLWRADDSAQIG
jgi:hypothetical protein